MYVPLLDLSSPTDNTTEEWLREVRGVLVFSSHI